MIGLILRGAGLGGEGGACLAGIIALCAVFGLYKCSQCRLRDCACCRRLLRIIGSDSFDDFDLMVVVHEAMYIAPAETETCVRISVGEQQAVTDTDRRGIFHQPLSVLVEQGSECLLVELMDGRGKQALAALELDLKSDIVQVKDPIKEEIYTMTQKNKGIRRPRIKLTIYKDDPGDAGCKFLESLDLEMSVDADDKVGAMVVEQIRSVAPHKTLSAGSGGAPPSKHQVLADGNTGPLDMLRSWGTWDRVHASVRCPPKHKRYKWCIWDSERDFEGDKKPAKEVDLLRVIGVQADPYRDDVFIMEYRTDPRTDHTEALTFQNVDRHRDVWVEMLLLQIRAAREEKARQKDKKRG